MTRTSGFRSSRQWTKASSRRSVPRGNAAVGATLGGAVGALTGFILGEQEKQQKHHHKKKRGKSGY
ncbi:hypothetical protein [Geotalea uraniireducens]|uniref:hypothetical protein n=1 Tax=Geotalea uraniireducens TaxID=351604 RepID=UPI0002F3DC81|nr:hypothetical protein [Geotalea uraniireducens]